MVKHIGTLGLVGLLFLAVPVRADLFALPSTPDLASAYITVTYDAGSHVFTAVGLPQTLNVLDGPPAEYSIAGSPEGYGFSLTAYIDNSGHLLSGGSLTITGALTDPGETSGELLSGTPTAFESGVSVTGGGTYASFDFLVGDIGGLLGPAFGNLAGVRLDPQELYMVAGDWDGDWSNSFWNYSSGVSDTARVVPAPGAVVLGLLGLGCVRGGLKRRWMH